MVGTSSIAANFTGWLLYSHRASESPDRQLQRDRHRGDGERDDEAQPVMPVSSSAHHLPKAYTDATRNPPTTYAATSMRAAMSGIASLKITPIGSTSTTLPAESRVNP